MKNGNKLIFSCTDIPAEETKKTCEINGSKCNKKAKKTVAIESHPCAGNLTICNNPCCYQQATKILQKRYNHNGKQENGRNLKHRQ